LWLRLFSLAENESKSEIEIMPLSADVQRRENNHG
jgi:hypothetical protein